MVVLSNGQIYTGERLLKDKSILIKDGVINGLIDTTHIPQQAEIIDCRGAMISPGLLDLQIYGGGGYLFSANPTAESLHAIADALVAQGTTGFLITLATNSMEVFMEAIRAVRDNPHPAVLGLHLEGPYINPQKRGAHIEEYVKAPERKEVEKLLQEAEGVVKMMTLAPEVTDPEIIRLLTDNHVIVSAGHSAATFGQAKAGFDQGITCTTHLYNAMSPLHHRDTGLPGATFQSDNVRASIVADGVHVDFNAISIAKKIMKERLLLITDAIEESLEGPYIHIRKADRFTLPDGTLSGSCLTLLQAVENMVKHVEVPLEEALRMASLYPAQILKRPDLGSIAVGSKADLLVFNKDFEVQQVWLSGTRHY
ncbi:N-acetylglucosamine-6-phosphate deacetylase [Arcticibacter sp.]|uniref:N-acetylglucosamine-6-phosphate deacetylase n=1 Tax=Arcticibacter sp. TaxID=1872630 RepID=UPI003890E72C